MANYTFRLEKFHIDNTRALHNDTDTVAFSLKVGDQPILTKTKGMGDVNNGDHTVGLQLGPVSIDPFTPVVISFLIVNAGYPGSHEGDTNTVLGVISDASEKVANALYPLGPVWPIVNEIIHKLNNLFFADCDGAVAGDRIPGPRADGLIPANILTGANLDTLIASEGGTFSSTRFYPGTDSAVGCGSNSRYTVTWSVHPQTAGTIPLYRLYNAQTNDHFYTPDTDERDGAIVQFGYTSEGISCYVFNAQVAGTTPLYRLYSAQTNDHFYTSNSDERDGAIVQFGYTSEGISCYVFNAQVEGTTPLYRLYNAQTKHHFYTPDSDERDGAIAKFKYTSEGISCYVYS